MVRWPQVSSRSQQTEQTQEYTALDEVTWQWVPNSADRARPQGDVARNYDLVRTALDSSRVSASWTFVAATDRTLLNTTRGTPPHGLPDPATPTPFHAATSNDLIACTPAHDLTADATTSVPDADRACRENETSSQCPPYDAAGRPHQPLLPGTVDTDRYPAGGIYRRGHHAGRMWVGHSENQGTNFVVTGETGSCRYDNHRCHQWRQSCHHTITTTTGDTSDNKVGMIPQFSYWFSVQ